MAFRKDRTTAAQTAANVAGNVTAALVSAGQVTTADAAAEAAVSVFTALFAQLSPVVDADNVIFAEQDSLEAAKPRSAPRSGYRPSTPSAPQANGKTKFKGDAAAARALDLTFGKFKGVTLGNLEVMPASEAKDYGHGEGDKPGKTYLIWLSKNENNEYVAEAAQLILEDLKASSDA